MIRTDFLFQSSEKEPTEKGKVLNLEGPDIKSLYINELEGIIRGYGQPAFRAGQVFSWLHEKLVTDYEDMTNIPKELRSRLKADYPITALKVADSLRSAEDDTVKYLFMLQDKRVIESVLMKYHHGNSVCISSQVGCRMGCKFCASTIGGKERDLTPSEMLEQVYRIQAMTAERVSNVVIMGCGEPLDNYDNVVRFIRLISDPKGLNLSPRSITISTCGIPDKIRQLAQEGLPVTLALSLHAPNDEVRKQLMPIAYQYGLSEVLDAVRYYFDRTGRRVTFEYSMIDGVNDKNEHASELVRLIKGINCHVNLIPVNRVKEREFSRSKAENIHFFKNTLEKNRINVTIRREMGTDIDAACGQLRKRYIENMQQ